MRRSLALLVLAALVLPLHTLHAKSADIIECDRGLFSSLERFQLIREKGERNYRVLLFYSNGEQELAKDGRKLVTISPDELASQTATKKITELLGYNLILHFGGDYKNISLEIADECTSNLGYDLGCHRK